MKQNFQNNRFQISQLIIKEEYVTRHKYAKGNQYWFSPWRFLQTEKTYTACEQYFLWKKCNRNIAVYQKHIFQQKFYSKFLSIRKQVFGAKTLNVAFQVFSLYLLSILNVNHMGNAFPTLMQKQLFTSVLESSVFWRIWKIPRKTPPKQCLVKGCKFTKTEQHWSWSNIVFCDIFSGLNILLFIRHKNLRYKFNGNIRVFVNNFYIMEKERNLPGYLLLCYLFFSGGKFWVRVHSSDNNSHILW